MKKIEENLAKHEKQMSLSLAIMPTNPIITARGDYNAELLYSLLKIILKCRIAVSRSQLVYNVTASVINSSFRAVLVTFFV